MLAARLPKTVASQGVAPAMSPRVEASNDGIACTRHVKDIGAVKGGDVMLGAIAIEQTHALFATRDQRLSRLRQLQQSVPAFLQWRQVRGFARGANE